MPDLDTSQRYEIKESLERLYRLLRGDTLADDSPNTLSGPSRPENEILSRIAELMQGSLPDETFTFPQVMIDYISYHMPVLHSLLYIGTAAGYFQVSSSGTLQLGGEATTWDDLRFPATSTKLGGSKDPGFSVFKFNGTGSQGVFTYWFDGSQEEEVYLMAQMPHSWKQGSSISPHVHWTPSANGTGTVSWGLEYSWANIAGVFPATSFMYANSNLQGAVNISGSVHYLTEFPDITGSSKTISSMLAMRLFRNATGGGGSGDSYTGDAGLLEFDIHYQIDSLGSNEEHNK